VIRLAPPKRAAGARSAFVAEGRYPRPTVAREAAAGAGEIVIVGEGEDDDQSRNPEKESRGKIRTVEENVPEHHGFGLVKNVAGAWKSKGRTTRGKLENRRIFTDLSRSRLERL